MSWLQNTNYNRQISTYFKGYVDISGFLILRNNSDLLFEIGTISASNYLINNQTQYLNNLNSYNSFNQLIPSLYSNLLTISSQLGSFISLYGNLNNTLIVTGFKTVSSIIYTVSSISSAIDLSGNYSSLKYNYNTPYIVYKYISISSLVNLTSSGLIYNSTLYTLYLRNLNMYNAAINQQNFYYLSLTSLSGVVYSISGYIPIYKSLNTILNDYQNQLNTISNNIKNQINNNTFQYQINTLSSSIIFLSNNTYQSQINLINNNTYQNQINTLSSNIFLINNNTYQNQINTLSSNIFLINAKTYQTQLNTLSSVITGYTKSLSTGSINITGNLTSSNINSNTTGDFLFTNNTTSNRTAFYQGSNVQFSFF